MGHVHFLLDEMGLDKIGLDEMGWHRNVWVHNNCLALEKFLRRRFY